ncbi:PD-(D/E)XK nuclease family protein [Sphaerisporangium corydalis]|uniref:PD-(D/E)XK nuclease family protein n=1 Tax=Sphaerisporangium corydalis TaxID=1441875 RepID=A0ABV9EQY3_9ACTN|nr:PD-(D/E)XK nuclease family protein [Sphaerisporangium corydalis]
MRGLDLQETQADSRHKVCHPVHIAWAKFAIRNYFNARRDFEAWLGETGQQPTHPVSGDWVAINQLAEPDARGARRYERTAWGRRYASADGSIRELWLLSVNGLKESRSEAQIVAAAYVAAFGVAATSSYGSAFVPVQGAHPPAETVRVVAVGCGDGKWSTLGEWDTATVARRYKELVRPALAQMISDEETVPGSDCVDCDGLIGCVQPPRTPHLLGVARRQNRKRRSVSASDLRIHAACPAQFHACRVLHLRSPDPEPLPIRRGRAVDDWLNLQHKARPIGGCRSVPLPEMFPDLGAEEPAALAMVKAHRAVCPLDGLRDQETVLTQHTVTAYDEDADVVVIALPDLLYTDGGGWVWRETKTLSTRLWEGRPLLEAFPQLALAVLLMSAGVLDGDPRRSRIELEVLYPDRPAGCEEIDPFDETTQAQAREVVSALAAPWAEDTVYQARPCERTCGTCDVRAWCEEGV